MKKNLGFLFAAAIMLSACGGGGTSVQNNNDAADSDTIKIGTNLELSGAVAAYGNAEKQGIALAVEEINADGGILGKEIEIVEKDNKSDNDEAASVAANLATSENVIAVVGPATSGAVKASIGNLTKSKVPLVTPSGTDDSITIQDGNVQEFVFRACFQDSFQGVILAKYADDNLKAGNAVIIGDSSSDYAKGLTKSFKESYKGEIVAEENFVAGDKDFQAILTNIKGKDFDVIYVPGYYTEAGLIIKQAREMGITQPIIGADGFGDEKLVETAGAANVSDVYYTGHFSVSAPANEKVEPFVEAFTKKYDTAPSAFNALGYDAIYMIKQAIEDQDAADAAAITKGLTELTDFIGVTGTMTMDKDHNPEKSAVVLGMTEGVETSAETVNP